MEDYSQQASCETFDSILFWCLALHLSVHCCVTGWSVSVSCCLEESPTCQSNPHRYLQDITWYLPLSNNHVSKKIYTCLSHYSTAILLRHYSIDYSTFKGTKKLLHHSYIQENVFVYITSKLDAQHQVAKDLYIMTLIGQSFDTPRPD